MTLKRHSWRHLNFFQYEAYLTARVSRVSCVDCGIKAVEVPWARSENCFNKPPRSKLRGISRLAASLQSKQASGNMTRRD